MANITVTPQKLARGTAGLIPTAINLLNTDTYFIGQNDGTVFLFFEGDATNARNVTIVTQQTVDGMAVTDVVIPVASGATSRKVWGPIPTGDIYMVGGLVTLTVDGTGVKMYALKL